MDKRSYWLRSISFAVGFSMMTMEIVAGRLIAPYLGSSLYTWTAVLVSVLLGITFGSYVGGLLSKKKNLASKIFVWLGMSGAVLATVVFLLIPLVGPWLRDASLSLAVLTTTFSLIIFLPPSLVLSVITPLLVKSEIHEIDESGMKYGTLAAWNAAGSILGTYLSGIILLGFFNTFYIIAALSVLLIVLAGGELVFSKKKA